MKENWEIVKQFVMANEDTFMEYLENEHEIEGSDMDFILAGVEAKLKFHELPVITMIAKKKGKNGRIKTHYLVGDRWFDLTGLAARVPANAYGDLLSAQALNGRIAKASNPLNNPGILAPRLTEAERILAITASRQGDSSFTDPAADMERGGLRLAVSSDVKKGNKILGLQVKKLTGGERRTKLKAIPLGQYDNV